MKIMFTSRTENLILVIARSFLYVYLCDAMMHHHMKCNAKFIWFPFQGGTFIFDDLEHAIHSFNRNKTN